MKKLYECLKYTSVFLFLLASSVAFAQERTVSGNVKDEAGNPMPGVNVLLKGSALGTVTDASGQFRINVSNDQSVLILTFIGYATQEIAVGQRSVIDSQLALDTKTLSEIVVTGYTEQRTKDITGAVAVVDPDALKSIKASNIGSQLAGRAPGVQVSTSGTPGDGANIRIRGISSLASTVAGANDPLIVIDGVQIQGDKALNGLNPNDIESMQVLKDAAASSIYGARANAGVIVITTKQGKKGAMKVSYNGYYGVQSAVGGYNDFLVIDPLQYARQYHTIKNPATSSFYGGVGSAAQIPDVFYNPPGNTNPATYNYPADPRIEPTLFMNSNKSGTDWWAATFDKSAPIMNHNISLSGGGDLGTVAASVDYFKQDGTMKYTNFERFSVRVNSQLKAGRFTFGQSLTFNRSTNVGQRGGNQNEQNTMTQILKMNSVVPIYDISGVNFASAKTVGFSNGSNPYALQWRNKDNQNINYRMLGGLNAEFKITDFLKVKTAYSVDFSQSYNPNFQYPTWENREFNSTNFFQEQHQTGFNWVWTNMVQFNKTFASKHNVTAFVGYEAVKNQSRRIGGRVDNFGFTNTDIRYLSQALAPTVNYVNSTAPTLNTLASVFFKADYAFDEKYLLSVTVRRDGSSNFASAKRYGNFPAFSVGWRISRESFMQNLGWIDELKLRGGYGVTGNQIINSYNAYDRYGARSTFDASYDIAGTNTGNNAGYTLTNYGNPNTGWEENRMTNVGLDASLMNGKLTIVFDWFNKDIKDLLYDGAYPGTAGAAAPPFRNTANMTNKGYDGAINYRATINRDLSINIGVNFSHVKNTVTKLEGDVRSVIPQGVDLRFGQTQIIQVGYPVSSYYGYTLDGIFQNAAEVAALDQTGKAIGRFRFKDLNGDGVINDSDKGIIGSPMPDLTLGINLGVNYKSFDFTALFFGSFGNKIYNYNKLFTHFGFFNSNISKDVLSNSWTSEGVGSLPKIDPDDNFSLASSTFYVEDGSYLRAQNMTLGYTFPKTKVFSKLRVYLQGQNLFTITGYKGIDPAISSVNTAGSNQNDTWAGYDFGNYPSSKTYMIGVNATF